MDWTFLKQAAVDKVPVFSKFERKVSIKELEKMMIKHYPDAIPGSLKLEPKVESYPMGGRGQMFFNFIMDSTNPRDQEIGLTGSVIIAIENHRNAVRIYSYVNIDG